MAAINPKVLDLSHHNIVQDFGKVRAWGIEGIIHKATQGTSMVDPFYAQRRKSAVAAGLLWGAYHFATSAPVDKQVAHFLKNAAPDDRTLLALDFEPNDNATMSIAQARAFLELIEEKTGRKAVLYSGNLIKETQRKADPYFAAHRLWLASYGANPKMPASWTRPWLWQFTDGKDGPMPHAVPGIKPGGLDINSFGGVDLAKEWAAGDGWSADAKPAEAPIDGHESGRPTLRRGSRGYPAAVAELQRALGAHGQRGISDDGVFGAKTEAAVRAFQKAAGLKDDGIVGRATWAKLLDA